MICCFSGTGNSRYIAKQIAEALQEKVIDLNVKIKSHDTTPMQTGRNLIIVTPTYAWRIPRIVSEWILKTEFTDAEHILFVMDCGSEIGNAAKYNQDIAEQKKLHYMGTAQIIMPENYIAMFNEPHVIEHLRKEQTFPAPRNNIYDRFMSGPVNPVFYTFLVKANAFQAGDTCISCGQCVKKCPTNNIQLKAGKPAWGKSCTHCMACICYCPVEAIEYGKKSVGKPRYHFEELQL